MYCYAGRRPIKFSCLLKNIFKLVLEQYFLKIILENILYPGHPLFSSSKHALVPVYCTKVVLSTIVTFKGKTPIYSNLAKNWFSRDFSLESLDLISTKN